jgi:transposase
LRRRRDEWEQAGVFPSLAEEAIGGYDRIIGLDLSDVAIDGSLHKAPFGGEGTGPNPTDRGKRGWKWSIATDRAGVPFAWVPAAANANDSTLFAPTLRAIDARGLLVDVETLHLDRGYQSHAIRELCRDLGIEPVIPKPRPVGSKKSKNVARSLGARWPVERANSWLSNFGQLRRNTDRFTCHRDSAIALAVALIITVKLVKWAKRWNG